MNLQMVAGVFADNGMNGTNSNVYASNFFLIIDIRAKLNEEKKSHSDHIRDDRREKEIHTFLFRL